MSLSNIIASEQGKNKGKHVYFSTSIRRQVLFLGWKCWQEMGGVVGPSRFFKTFCRGTSELLGCLMSQTSCRPSIGPIGTQSIILSKPDCILARNWEKNRTSRNGTSINFYGDYHNIGITSNGKYATNIHILNASEVPQNRRRKSERTVTDFKVKRQSTRSTNDVEETIDNNEIEDEHEINELTEFDHDYHNLDPSKMWTLKSGTVVEKEEIITSEVKARPKLESSLVELLKSARLTMSRCYEKFFLNRFTERK
ncbi:12565_t:CDS:2 [Ambispora gerdemannii]|uniref:12565_t:CDS:1 n=1 Tax=Ambispora gerdemannii TaxID=144530 RepID=A0A9N9GDU3_9GLOM|nr:12565_t:CDS:2 [Ambispora gerdemannii]